MATLRSLQRKLKTAADLLSVVKTMKSLASVNIRQFERAVESLEEYNRVVELAWTVFLRQSEFVPLQKGGETAVFFVIGTDQGMCGQFNEVVLERTMQAEAELQQKTEVVHWTAGERLEAGIDETGRKSMLSFELPGSLAGIDRRVMDVVQYIEVWNREKQVNRFYLVHNMSRKGGGYTPVFYKVLPLDREWFGRYGQRDWGRRNIPMLNLETPLFFSSLFRQYLYISLFRAFAQSLAGENAARLASMQSAEKNIQEMQDHLTGEYRQQRQNEITSELFDVVAGFEALGGEDTPA